MSLMRPQGPSRPFASLVTVTVAAIALLCSPPALADPVIAAAGDIACDPTSSSFNGGAGVEGECQQQATSDLLLDLAPDAVLTLGDNQYWNGAYDKFIGSYDPSWGRVKELTHPAVGNHEYSTAGAAGYFQYFGTAAGDPIQGFYSYDLGAWHLIVLNSNCSIVGGCAAGSPQEQWLRADLAAHPASCTLAYWHHPRFSSGPHGDNGDVAGLWAALYDAGADVVLNGHDHDYERFAPQTPDGVSDDARGIREFVAGTGGRSHYVIRAADANSEVFDGTTFGVLALTLHDTGYEWRFIPEAGGTFSDSGSGSCHWKPLNTARPTVSGTAQDGQTLTAEPGSWSASPPPNYTYQWRRCDLAGINCTSIAGATADSYQLTTDDVGWRIRVRVLAANAVGRTYAFTNPTATVLAAPPANVAAPVVSGLAQDGEVLTADTGSWTGTPPMTFSYQWRRCDSAGINCSSILGATADSYQLTADDVGWRIRVRVLAANAGGRTYAFSNPTATVLAAPPVNVALPVLSGLTQDGEVLTADTGSWTGTQPISYTYQWRRCDLAGINCTSIPGASADSYQLTTDDIGWRIRARVYAANAAGGAYAFSKPTAAVLAALT